LRILRLLTLVLSFVSGLQAQTAQPPVTIAPRLDTPQARVIVATLQPRMPVNARTGHATDRVLIFLDDGAMTRTDGDRTAKVEFHRGDVRWSPASGPYVAENIGERPIRILEIDLKGPPGAPITFSKLDPVATDSAHYRVAFENEHVRVLRVHYGGREQGATHEHLLNRVVLYLNDQPGAKADDVRMAGPATHAEENASAQPADRIAVEIK
jgi:mannose-6-phosphate isomerase-like protein (cupin superfamily)